MRRGARRGVAVLLAVGLAASGLLAGCATSTPVAVPAPSAETNAVIDDEYPPLKERSAEQEAALAEEERATDVDELGYVPGQIVVVYESDATEAEREEAVESLGAEESGETAEFDSGAVSSVAIDDDMTVETAVRQAQAEEAVQYAMPNYVVELFDDPAAEAQGAIGSDTRSAEQWYLDFIDAPEAWDLLPPRTKNDEPVKVAVLDTGASLSHADLTNVIDKETSAEVVWTDSSSAASWKAAPLRGDGYTNGGMTVDEFSSHGTHVSGIIAGEAGNGGILGVASGGTTANANKLVDLVVIDAFSLLVESNGTKKANATLQDLVFALLYARDAGCDIVNMSLGVQTDNEKVAALFEQLCAELTEKNDMLVISAAGNSNTTATCYPAACDSVLGVISISERKSVSSSSRTFLNPAWGNGGETVLRSYFSNYGTWCDISAPGENILSTYLSGGKTNTYTIMQGTSMACPVVTGVAALVLAADPTLKPAEVRRILCSTATDLFNEGKDAQTGYGAINARAAVAAALGEPLEPQDVPQLIDINQAQVTVSALTYTGATQTPRVTVKLDGKTLAEDTDYDVRFAVSPKKAGSYEAIIEGYGDYTGSKKVPFAVSPADVSAANIQVKDQVYTGKALTPRPVVTWKSTTLVQGTDYTVSYANNVNAGTAKVTIKGIGNYTGSQTATFAIARASLDNAASTSTDKAPATPAPAPAPAPATSTTASPGPAAGTTVTAPVNKASAPTKSANPSAPVAVAKKNLAAASVSGVAASYGYTGKAISPRPVVRYGGVLLREGVDYTVGYRNNRALGTAVLTMTGTGSYKGALQLRFSIKAPTVKAPKLSKVKAAKKAFAATWKKAAGSVSSYQLQYSTSKKFTKKTTATVKVKTSSKSSLSKTVKKLKAKKTYYVRVRTVYQVGDKAFYSSWSTVKKVTTKR